METLLSGMLSKIGENGIEKISQSARIDPATAKKILAQAGPLIAGKMADNAKKPEGLSSLDKALQDHDGSIFDRIGDLTNPQVDTKGAKILGHIFGGSKEKITEAVAKNNNVDSSTTAKILEMAAPLILGQLGSQKKSNNLDAGSIFDLLKGEKKSSGASGDSMFMDLAEQFLDKDDDGSIVDDLIGMAGKLFKK